ncbi:hypothetical protein Y1Q_0023386 [Alligator mississippiensis]|uniref:Uncharacterized protein n=1 Tax=Alligator mississippiensis TaxID=8496 RepID=A0A151NQA7_ALLMI|nr:hypothetical protein Y1Q_0023386 [Alligator mississippiensis]
MEKDQGQDIPGLPGFISQYSKTSKAFQNRAHLEKKRSHLESPNILSVQFSTAQRTTAPLLMSATKQLSHPEDYPYISAHKILEMEKYLIWSVFLPVQNYSLMC